MKKMASLELLSLSDLHALNDSDSEVWKAGLFTELVSSAKTSIQLQMHEAQQTHTHINVEVWNQSPALSTSFVVVQLYEYTDV